MLIWRDLVGAYGRKRRALRRALLEPILVGWPVLREVSMNALAARGHLVFCDLGDVRFFADPSDRVVGTWLIWHGGWQRREILLAVELLSDAERLRPDSVFVDVGAHIGTHTVYALQAGRFARAVAFEPDPRNARVLAMNLEINGFAGIARVVQKAAGSSAGNASLHLHPRNTGAHTIGAPPSMDGRDRIEVPIVRVGDELKSLGVQPAQVGLVWVDVEGYEAHVLEGLASLIAESVPIVFEFTPSLYNLDTRRRLVDMLADRYTVIHSLGRRDPVTPISELISREHTDDLLVF